MFMALLGVICCMGGSDRESDQVLAHGCRLNCHRAGVVLAHGMRCLLHGADVRFPREAAPPAGPDSSHDDVHLHRHSGDRHRPVPMDAIRQRGRDEHEDQLAPLTASGSGEPLRCCLRYADRGEVIMLISYAQLPGPSVWREVRPVYVHAESAVATATAQGLPASFGSRTVPAADVRHAESPRLRAPHPGSRGRGRGAGGSRIAGRAGRRQCPRAGRAEPVLPLRGDTCLMPICPTKCWRAGRPPRPREHFYVGGGDGMPAAAQPGITFLTDCKATDLLVSREVVVVVDASTAQHRAAMVVGADGRRRGWALVKDSRHASRPLVGFRDGHRCPSGRGAGRLPHVGLCGMGSRLRRCARPTVQLRGPNDPPGLDSRSPRLGEWRSRGSAPPSGRRRRRRTPGTAIVHRSRPDPRPAALSGARRRTCAAPCRRS